MVRLLVPREGPQTYFRTKRSVFGPLEAIQDSAFFSESDLPFPEDTMAQSPGIGGDNNCTHFKYSGYILVLPSARLATDLPCESGIYGLSGFRTNRSYDQSGKLVEVVFYGLNLAGTLLTEVWAIVGSGYYHSGYNTLRYYERNTWDLSDLRTYDGINYYCKQSGVSWDFYRYREIEVPDGYTSSGTVDELITIEGSLTTYSRSSYMLQYPVKYQDVDPCDLNLVEQWISKCLVSLVPIDGYDYGELAYDALKSADENSVNMLEFISDLRHPSELIPKLKKLSMLKDASNLILQHDFGWLPTISDLKELFGLITKHGPFFDKKGNRCLTAAHFSRVSNGNGFVSSITQRIKIAVKEEEDILSSLYQQTKSMGFFPTLNNLWDLVPYSFVIDWFIDVGDFLERIDNRFFLATMDVQYVTMSFTEETQFVLPSSLMPFTGTVTQRYYHRWVSDQCPVPPLSLNVKQDFSHWVDAAALIYQRKH